MSNDSALLRDYIESLGMDGRELTQEDIVKLSEVFLENDDSSMASFVLQFKKNPNELLDYI